MSPLFSQMFPMFPMLVSTLGRLQAAWQARIPHVPNVPYQFLNIFTARAHIRARTRAHALRLFSYSYREH